MVKYSVLYFNNTQHYIHLIETKLGRYMERIEIIRSKIEKVPRDIQGEKSRTDTASSEKWSQKLDQKQEQDESSVTISKSKKGKAVRVRRWYVVYIERLKRKWQRSDSVRLKSPNHNRTIKKINAIKQRRISFAEFFCFSAKHDIWLHTPMYIILGVTSGKVRLRIYKYKI